MIKLIDSHYDKEDGGIACVRIATECGYFEGYAFLHPDDEQYESEFLGLEVAEMRATIEYYEKKLHFLNTRLLALYDIAKDIRSNPQYDSEHFEYQIIQKRIRQNEEQKEIYKEYIKDIKEAIKTKLEAHTIFINKINKKIKEKQDNE